MKCDSCKKDVPLVYIRSGDKNYHQSPKCLGNMFYEILETEMMHHGIASGILPLCADHDLDVVEFAEQSDCLMCGRPCNTKIVYVPITFEITNFY